MRKLLLFASVAALALLSGGADRAVTSMTPTSATDLTSGSITGLPGLGTTGVGEKPVPSPAQPAQPAALVASPATPATPALPPGAANVATSTVVNEDPCDGFNSMDARERCRENEQKRNERDQQRAEEQWQKDFNATHP